MEKVIYKCDTDKIPHTTKINYKERFHSSKYSYRLL